MAQYETVCVIKPDIQGEKLDKITDKMAKVLGDFKADKINKKDWGIRRLAYPIANQKTAHYLYYTYEAESGVVAELERQFNYEDSVLRYLTVKLDKNSHTELQPEVFQFGKAEAESYSHPFGGGAYEKRDRYDRGPRRDFRDSRSDDSAKSNEER